MGQSRHGGHVDHVKDLVLHHAQVVKNPDSVSLNREILSISMKIHVSQGRQIRTIKVLGNSYNMSELCFVCSSRPSCGPRPSRRTRRSR